MPKLMTGLNALLNSKYNLQLILKKNKILLPNYKWSPWVSLIVFTFLFGINNLRAQRGNPETVIQNGYLHGKRQGTQIQLELINQELDSIFEITGNTFNRYWLSYGLYNQALLAGIQEDDDKAEILVDRAIELLNPLKDDAESLALLSLEQGYSTQFKSYISLISIGRNAVLNAKRAAELNPRSLRANLALATNDFYTPKVFGGGKLTLQYLNNAIKELNTKPSDSLPTWGMPSVYELFYKYYIKNENESLAKYYLNQGLKEFPESKLLQGLK
jgi:hypothetical protein